MKFMIIYSFVVSMVITFAMVASFTYGLAEAFTR